MALPEVSSREFWEGASFAERFFVGLDEVHRALRRLTSTLEGDGIPYAIDFLNPAPDADYHSVGPENFQWIVDAVAKLAVEQALREPANIDMRWASFLNAAAGRA